jgi:hypothetical protein
MKFSLIASAASLFIMTALAVPKSDVPDQSQVYFTKPPTYGGSGCPQGTTNVVLSPDQQSFTVIFDQFIAAAGPKYPTSSYKAREDCQLNLFVHIPQGWQYSIAWATYRGYIDIEAEVKATLVVSKILFQTSLKGNFFSNGLLQ